MQSSVNPPSNQSDGSQSPTQFISTGSDKTWYSPFSNPLDRLGYSALGSICLTFLLILLAWCLKWVGLHSASLWFAWLLKIGLGLSVANTVLALWKNVWTNVLQNSKLAITVLVAMPFWIQSVYLNRCYSDIEASIAPAVVKNVEPTKDK